ncbi:MAG: phosphotransferase [Gammaproteobacteria bacterium]
MSCALKHHGAGPRTLIHSDLHPGNWYLPGDGKPGLCDWQRIAQGHWARAVAYAMSAMLDVPHRRAWEREVLAHYLARLHFHGGPTVAFDDAWTLYRRQLPVALLMCAIDSEKFAAWNKSLIGNILFEAAKSVSAAPDGAAASATVNFRIAVDPDDGSLLIEV